MLQSDTDVNDVLKRSFKLHPYNFYVEKDLPYEQRLRKMKQIDTIQWVKKNMSPDRSGRR